MLITPADRVELRPTNARPLASFPPDPYTARGANQRMFVNGKSTAIVVPSGYGVDVRCRAPNGRIAGSILWSHLSDGGMDFVFEGHGFVTESGDRVHIVPISAQVLDNNGRALCVYRDPNEEDDAVPSYALFWDGHHIVALGPATNVRFGTSGRIEGYCVTTRLGRPIYHPPSQDNSMFRYVPFVWKDGFRDDGPFMRKPPF